MPRKFPEELATERQVAFMEKLELDVPYGLTKEAASDLISEALEAQKKSRFWPATNAQKRRLRFFGIEFDENTAKWDASDFIDDYLLSHPDAEEEYQAWKSRLPEWDEFGEHSARSRRLRARGTHATESWLPNIIMAVFGIGGSILAQIQSGHCILGCIAGVFVGVSVCRALRIK